MIQGLHRFKRGDVVHITGDLKKKGRWGMTETVVLEGARGIVQADQTFFGTKVPVEFVNGRTLMVSTDKLFVETKATTPMFSLLL